MLAQFPEPEAHDKVLDNNPDQGQEPTAKLDPHTKPSPAIKTGADRRGSVGGGGGGSALTTVSSLLPVAVQTMSP